MLETINGKKIFYQVVGEGEPLVLIHGLGTTHKMWTWQMEELEKDFQLILYDIPGHGESENSIPESNIYQGLADDLVALLDHLGIQQANLCGLSLGGRVALAVAIHHPERVKKLIMSSTFEGVISEAEKMRTTGALQMLPNLTVEIIAQSSAQTFFPEDSQLEARQLYIEEGKKVEKEAIVQFSKAADEVDYSDELGQITVPTQIFVGEKEPLMIQIAERMEKAIPNAQVDIIPGVGHVWNMEKPELFNQKVKDFIKG